MIQHSFSHHEAIGIMEEIAEIELPDDWALNRLSNVGWGLTKTYFSFEDAVELTGEIALIQPAENSYLKALRKTLDDAILEGRLTA